MNMYKYYATHRPVAPSTVPSGFITHTNYDDRQAIESVLAWGEVGYDHPLTTKEITNYELAPSLLNPDLIEKMRHQIQIVGEWEENANVRAQKRLTLNKSGTYVLSAGIIQKTLEKRYQMVQRINARAKHESGT